MPYVVQGLAFTVKAISIRTFTEGVEIRAERSGIIFKNRWRYLPYINLLSMHIPLTKKNVTLVGQTHCRLHCYKYPQLVSNTRSGRGMRCDEPLYYRSVSSKGAGRPRLTHHHKGWWNETKLMRWVWRNGGMKFVVGENGRNPEKNLPRPRLVHHETHMEGPRRELGKEIKLHFR